MTTTTTAAAGTGYALTDGEAERTADQWAEAYGWCLGDAFDTYEASVLAAAYRTTGERLQLTDDDLGRLLHHHGASLAELTGDCHPRLTVNHAGQALAWLGY